LESLPPSLKLNRNYSLKSGRIIGQLFQDGATTKAFPLLMRTRWTPLPRPVAIQLTISVGKRKWPRAVDRNRIKRRIREAWRLEKMPWEAHILSAHQQLAVVLIFVGNEIPEVEDLRRNLRKSMKKWLAQVDPIHLPPSP